ncbi:MAG: type II toxin-antitoxin system mRNA interferase toxin, RelE/StbE family [bacterium]
MRYLTSKKFERQFSKLSKGVKERAIMRIELFLKDPFVSLLNNNQLKGEWANCRSINVTPDIRLVYEMVEENVAYFVAIGSHAELYR